MPEHDPIIDRITGLLLRVGVVVSAFVLLVGGVLFLVHHGLEPCPDRKVFPADPEKLRPATVLKAARAGSGQAIILIGLGLLIATPILRVAFTVLAFAWRRDFLYVLIPLIVLAVLITGLLTGQAG
jgi:uncharacterized membrane protein